MYESLHFRLQHDAQNTWREGEKERTGLLVKVSYKEQHFPLEINRSFLEIIFQDFSRFYRMTNSCMN